MYEICPELTIKIPERRSTVFIVIFEHISHHSQVFLLLTLNKYVFAGSHPINLKMLKLPSATIIDRCTKIFVKWQPMKKNCDLN